MDQKAFDLVAGKTGGVLERMGYRREGDPEQGEDGLDVVYLGETNAYSIFYRDAKKRFELRSCDVSDGGPEGKWKSLSMWLYDPETDTPAQAESIAGDFIETIEGPQQIAAVRSKKKKKKSDDDTNDPLFFYNRFVNIFPELKGEINDEKAAYGEIRGVTFGREKLLPKLEALCAAGADKDLISRASTLLSDQYVNGDMDVRSVITIVLLNGLSAAAVENLAPQFGEELAKGYKSGAKMKGKKVKPEKQKKREKIMAQTLNDMNR